jgi:hypothetical protein
MSDEETDKIKNSILPIPGKTPSRINWMHSSALLVIILFGVSLIFLPMIADETAAEAGGSVEDSVRGRAVEPIFTPANGSLVNWHDLDHILVDYGTSPDISTAIVSVNSNVFGPLAVTLSISGNMIRVNLPDRDCGLGQGSIFHLYPFGEEITMDLSNVNDSSGASLTDVKLAFTVGKARLVVQNPRDGDYVGTNVVVKFTVENHTISGGYYGGPHMHYMYDEVDADNRQMHTTTAPLTYASLTEGFHLLIIDLRTPTHEWLGTEDSRVVVGVTVDTIEPMVIAEQLRPMPNAENVNLATNITARFNEEVRDGARIELLADETPLSGNLSLTVENNRSILTFTSTDLLTARTTYTVHISDVEDLAGNKMLDYEYTFKTIGKGETVGGAEVGKQSFLERYWEPLFAVGAILISIVGWVMLRRQKANVHGYLDKIDKKVKEQGNNLDHLDTELANLREEVTRHYRKGKLDENQYLVIEKKIDDSLSKARVRNISLSLEKTSPELIAAVNTALADGRIQPEEVEQVLNQAGELDAAQKAQLKDIMVQWAKKDNID